MNSCRRCAALSPRRCVAVFCRPITDSASTQRGGYKISEKLLTNEVALLPARRAGTLCDSTRAE